LQLIEQLPRHHDPLPAWVPGMRQELLSMATAAAPASACTGTGGLITIVGNCQSHPLFLGLEKALPAYRFHFCTPVHLATEADVKELHGVLPHTGLLVMHRILPGYRDGIGLDGVTLEGLLPPKARAVVLPNLHYEGYHPWIGYSRDPDGRLATVEADSPLGSYHDFLAMTAAVKKVDVSVLLDSTCPEELADLLRQNHRNSLAELRRREEECDVGIADWMEANHQHHALMHTINHPTKLALDQLLGKVLSFLEYALPLTPDLYDRSEHLGAIAIPIHPWVRQALSLGAWANHWGRRRETPLAIDQQLEESVRFYRHHSWIAASNAAHPKFQFASQCLDLLQQKTSRRSDEQLPVDLLHLHCFKCAGSTFIWSLEHACQSRVAYVESPRSNQRLDWQILVDQPHRLPRTARAITSHLITLPPPGSLARLKVAFLRSPLARIGSAFRFQKHVQGNQSGMSFSSYVANMQNSILANFQTRHLSPQNPEDWSLQQGWAAEPERIDWKRTDLFVGLVERYDESIVALEHLLEMMGCPMDLAYPQPLNTTTDFKRQHHAEDDELSPEVLAAVTDLDKDLYRKAERRLLERLAAIDDLSQRLADYRLRCQALRATPTLVRIKTQQEWIFLSPSD